jgi:hypothetical protein
MENWKKTSKKNKKRKGRVSSNLENLFRPNGSQAEPFQGL